MTRNFYRNAIKMIIVLMQLEQFDCFANDNSHEISPEFKNNINIATRYTQSCDSIVNELFWHVRRANLSNEEKNEYYDMLQKLEFSYYRLNDILQRLQY